jgi:hypothetical protein
VGVVVAVTALAACRSEPEAPRALSEPEFDAAVADVCADHQDDLEELDDEYFEDLDALDTEPEVETYRRLLVDLKRELVAELRRLEPTSEPSVWREALDTYEEAIDAASDGFRVDVDDEDLALARDTLIDDFGLDRCF